MKALIYIIAIVLMAAGAAVALISFLSPGQVVLGLNLGLAGSLIAGGAVSLGLGAVVNALENLTRRLGRVSVSPAAARDAGTREVETPSRARMDAAIGAGAAATAATAGAVAAASGETAAPREKVAPEERAAPRETVAPEEPEVPEETQEPAESTPHEAATERQIFLSPHAHDEDLPKASEAPSPEAVEETEEEETSAAEAAEEPGEEAHEEPEKDEAEEAAPAAAGEAVEKVTEEAGTKLEPQEAGEAEAAEEPGEEEAGEEEVEVAGLYVVEERVIRGRPARMLSDGTVEAETDEGWMRFENLEHLEEYMEAMSHAR